MNVFPYPGAYDASRCNTNTGVSEAVMSMPGCEGGFPGIFDMSGSVEEWEDSCAPGDSGTPAGDTCARRGGSYNDGSGTGNYECASSLHQARSLQSPDCGIRCCTK